MFCSSKIDEYKVVEKPGLSHERYIFWRFDFSVLLPAPSRGVHGKVVEFYWGYVEGVWGVWKGSRRTGTLDKVSSGNMRNLAGVLQLYEAIQGYKWSVKSVGRGFIEFCRITRAVWESGNVFGDTGIMWGFWRSSIGFCRDTVGSERF